MYVQNIVDMSLQKVGLEICYVMFMKYMEWLNVKYKNLWEKNSNLWIYNSSICNVYLFNFQVKVNLRFWQINFKYFLKLFTL